MSKRKEIINKLHNIYRGALERANPRRLVREALSWDGNVLRTADGTFSFKKLFVVGFGKAACSMAAGLEEAVPTDLFEGMVVTKYGHLEPLKKITAFEAGHPIPDDSSISATEKIIEFLEKAGEDDLVIFLISGGGSALLESPQAGISLEDVQQVTDVLLRSGAAINEINVVRKRLSKVKGGGLARYAAPAKMLSLVVSDVIGSDLSSIASGPTTGDPSTFKDCLNVFEKYELFNKIPESVVRFIEMGSKGTLEDTPFPDDPIFREARFIILADNDVFCNLIIDEAQNHFETVERITMDESTGLIDDYMKALRTIVEKGEKDGSLIVTGGEVTLKIPDGKTGLGGRNQHAALLFARDVLPLNKESVALFASTDGTDGPTDAGGGFSHRGLAEDMEKLHKALEDFNSYHFLKDNDELLITGPTGNNLNDVSLIYIWKREETNAAH